MTVTADAKLVPFNVFRWVNKDVAGRKAVVSQKRYWYQFKDGNLPVRVLKKIIQKTEKGKLWIYVYWHPENNNNDMNARDVGYSGWAEDIGEELEIPVLYFVEE